MNKIKTKDISPGGVKLSKPSKMPCKSWSLQALDTCPGSRNKDGSLVPACRGCYATTGNYRFPNVKAPRLHNAKDWQRVGWVHDMAHAIGKDRFFRWFDSGDMYSVKLARKILQVMELTPNTKHWIPTRMHKFNKFMPVIDQMIALPNVVVRLSSDSIEGGIIEGANTSTIIPTVDDKPKGAVVCGAYANGGKCGDCRDCWNKDIKVIAYPAHGQKMLKMVANI